MPMPVVQMPEVVMVPVHGAAIPAYSTTRCRLYRNPDDKMLGGVISGMAAYLELGCDFAPSVAACRVDLWGRNVDTGLYRMLADYPGSPHGCRVNMRGEAVTVEGISERR